LSENFVEMAIFNGKLRTKCFEKIDDKVGNESFGQALFSAEGTAVGARRLRRFNALLPTGYGLSNSLLLATLKQRKRVNAELQ